MLNEVNEFFGPESPLREQKGYEERPQQAAMAEAIAQAMYDGENLCVEAPTGVGKTFAYLVPAVYHAASTGRPVIISTHTINLQEQIMTRDIPLLSKLLHRDIKAVVSKGRSNYLCLRRYGMLGNMDQELIVLDAIGAELQRLQKWVNYTTTGDRSEMPRGVSSQLWNRVCAERGNCLKGKCPFFHRCYLQRARRALDDAELIIINHAKFFSELVMMAQMDKMAQIDKKKDQEPPLPEYSAVIMDEGHTIEDTAGDHLGLCAETFALKYLLGRLYNSTTQMGLLTSLSDEKARQATIECRRTAELFFASVADWVLKQEKNPLRYIVPNHIHNYLDVPIGNLVKELEAIIKGTEDDEKKVELNSIKDELKEFNDTLETFFSMGMPNCVYWFECDADEKKDLTMYVVPVDVAPPLSELLFAKKPVIVTSATLAVNGNMSYFQRKIGAFDSRSLMLDSPFDYPNQVKIYVSSTMPDPRDKDLYTRKAVVHIERFLRMTQGRAFVLFTSYSMMRSTARAMENFFKEEKMTLLMQGEDQSPRQMLENFRTMRRGVIFGTSSFWTGVDVPGDALQNVIITKLPFAVPDHPLIEARNQLVEQRGGRPFFENSVPEAILKFRQGFGRLIRTRQDKGIIVILDSRVATKGYGKQFLNSIPACPVEYF